MRKCYASALLLVAWFLMLPPPVFPPVKDTDGSYKMNDKLPISQWLKLKTLDSEAACKAELKKMPSFYKCIASYDTALKPPNPSATPATTGH